MVIHWSEIRINHQTPALLSIVTSFHSVYQYMDYYPFILWIHVFHADLHSTTRRAYIYVYICLIALWKYPCITKLYTCKCTTVSYVLSEVHILALKTTNALKIITVYSTCIHVFHNQVLTFQIDCAREEEKFAHTFSMNNIFKFTNRTQKKKEETKNWKENELHYNLHNTIMYIETDTMQVSD